MGRSYVTGRPMASYVNFGIVTTHMVHDPTTVRVPFDQTHTAQHVLALNQHRLYQGGGVSGGPGSLGCHILDFRS